MNPSLSSVVAFTLTAAVSVFDCESDAFVPGKGKILFGHDHGSETCNRDDAFDGRIKRVGMNRLFGIFGLKMQNVPTVGRIPYALIGDGKNFGIRGNEEGKRNEIFSMQTENLVIDEKNGRGKACKSFADGRRELFTAQDNALRRGIESGDSIG